MLANPIKSIKNFFRNKIKRRKKNEQRSAKCIQFEYQALRQEQVHAETYLRQDKLRQICTNEQKKQTKRNEHTKHKEETNKTLAWKERRRKQHKIRREKMRFTFW